MNLRITWNGSFSYLRLTTAGIVPVSNTCNDGVLNLIARSGELNY